VTAAAAVDQRRRATWERYRHTLSFSAARYSGRKADGSISFGCWNFLSCVAVVDLYSDPG